MAQSALNWFEIPAVDFDRARKFYGAILRAEISPMENGPMKLGMLPVEEGGVGGAIAHGEMHNKPSLEGTLVYLTGGDDLNDVLGRVEAAGGKVLQPKMDIGVAGFIAIFQDTEGNRVGLHSMG